MPIPIYLYVPYVPYGFMMFRAWNFAQQRGTCGTHVTCFVVAFRQAYGTWGPHLRHWLLCHGQ